MGRDFSKMTPQQLEEIYQANFGQEQQTQAQPQQMPIVQNNGFPTQASTYGQNNVPQGMEGRPNPGVQAPPQATSQTPDVQALLQKLQPQNLSFGQSLSNAMSVLGGGKQVYDSTPKMSDNPYLQKALGNIADQQFKNPQEEQLKLENLRLENESLKQPPRQGFIRNGKQLLADPDYIKPADQRKFDEEDAQKQAEADSLTSSAQDSISTIENIKKGSKYFGPLGKLPTYASPSSLTGEYGPRKNWENNVNKLLSQKVVDLISEMKRVSKTGATGFGQLSDREGAMLQQASTALTKDLPEQDALHYLNEMEKIYQKVLGGGGQSQPQSQGGDVRSQYNALRAQGVSSDDAKRQLGL